MLSVTPQTIRAKMILVVFFILTALGSAVIAIGSDIYSEYKVLQVAQCRSQVAMQTEQLRDSIRTLQDNVRELALAGELLLQSGTAQSALPGRHVVSRNFQINTLAVGGGIWFRPFVLDPERERVCYYAFSEDGRIIFDESFESPEYHYPTQSWYVAIKGQLEESGRGGGNDTAWTAPYIDATGTRALMTTVGGAMYDQNGIFAGMATVDWRLDDIAARIEAVRPTPGSFTLFADLRHDYILALSEAGRTGSPVGQRLATVEWFRGDALEERELVIDGKPYLSFAMAMDNGMAVVVNVPAEELFQDINRAMRFTVLALVGTVLLVVSVTWLMLNRFINKPVAYLSRQTAKIGGGDLDVRVDLDSGDELGVLAVAIDRMARNLKDYIDNLNAVTSERERFATELSIARDIQSSMLPTIFPPFPERRDVNLHAFMLPAKEVGGDFYDFFLIDDDHLAVVIADVSDKGVPAALFMVIAKTLIRNNAQVGGQAGDILAGTNAQLCENNGTGMFVTAVVGILHLRTGLFAYANAGHNPLFIRRNSGTFEPLPMPKGLVLAAMEEAVYRTETVTLQTGDALFLYTDGVTEAESQGGVFFGEARLKDSLDRHAVSLSDDLSGFLTSIRRDLEDFAAGAMRHDDITMLALVFAGPEPPVSGEPERDRHEAGEPGEKTSSQQDARVFKALVSCLPEYLEFVEQRLEKAGCPGKRILRFALAAEEMFVNIASYAYKDEPDPGEIEARFAILEDPAGAELRLIDSGVAFNPLEVRDPDVTLPAEERDIGGLGVFLAGKNTSGMAYERRDGRNILTMRVHWP